MATSRIKAKDIGSRVEAHRLRLGLSRPGLAEQLGIERTQIWRIETGRSRPSLDLLDKMARLFGVTAPSLLRERRAA